MTKNILKRAKRAVKREFRRIRDEHRNTGPKRKKPPFRYRLRYWWTQTKMSWTSFVRKPADTPKMPPFSKRIKRYLHKQREKYGVVFTWKYLIITLNSTVLYLISYFIVHFLTHLVTGITAYYSEISTTLNYTMVDFHIRYWEWTPEMVILVFSVPAIFAIVLAILASLPFAPPWKWPRLFRHMPYFTKKQRYQQKRRQRKKELDMQVQRLTQVDQIQEVRKQKKRISWTMRLFLLWIVYHSLTYFFSGLLYSFLFHRRLGYVTWYAFNSYYFDVLFSVVAFLLMIIIGYSISVQFFYSGRMYLNELNERNRMPFLVSQAIIPFVIGTIVTVVMQIPVFDPALILLNFSIFFLLLPLPSRAARFGSLHFDRLDKTAKINWIWILWTAIVVLAIYIAVKIGIPISYLQH
jgi:hypothetical protein